MKRQHSPVHLLMRAMLIVLLALLLVGTVAAAVASVMYFLTLGKLERKLNLA